MKTLIARFLMLGSLSALAGCSAMMAEGYTGSSAYTSSYTYDPYLDEMRRQTDLLERQTKLAEREARERDREPKFWPGTSIPMGNYRDKKEREFYRKRAYESEEFKRKNAGWQNQVACVTKRQAAGEKDAWTKCK